MLRARLLARLAGALRDEPSLEPRASLSREAVEIARRLGDDDTLAYTLTSLFMATWGPDVDELAAIADEVGRLAEETGSADAALDALTLKGVVAWLTLADDAETVDDQLTTRWPGSSDRRHRGGRARCRTRSGRSSAATSPTAEQLEEDGAAIGARPQRGRRLLLPAGDVHPAPRAGAARRRSRTSSARRSTRTRATAHSAASSRVLECELGRESEARRAFDELAEERLRRAAARQRVAVLPLAARRGRGVPARPRPRPTVLYRLLAPYARVNAMAAGEVALGPVARYLGILATTTSRWDEAAAHFEDAIAMNARMGARPWLAHTQHDYARMLLARDRPGDNARARELVAEGGLDLSRAGHGQLGASRWGASAARAVLSSVAARRCADSGIGCRLKRASSNSAVSVVSDSSGMP